MKRFVRWSILLCLFFTYESIGFAKSQEIKGYMAGDFRDENGYWYFFNIDSTECILSYVEDRLKEEYTFPGSVTFEGKNYPVTNVNGAGSVWFSKFPNIKKVTFEEGFQAIGQCCKYCKTLESVILPNSVTFIVTQSFYGCENLKEVRLSDEIKEIAASAFAGCINLESITTDKIETKTGYTGKGTFVLPDKLETIGADAFRGNTSLKRVDMNTIFPKLKTIGSGAFSNCENLSEIFIPSSVDNLESGAFSNCKSLHAIVLPYPIQALKGRTFMGCEHLSFINLPNGITSIGEAEFSGCTRLQTVELSVKLQRIPNRLFEKCISLLKVDIPDLVKVIGDQAFSNCENLRTINFGKKVGNIGRNAFEGCNSLEDVEIPNSIIEIDFGAFSYCTNLSKIKLSDNLTIINPWLFSGCSNLDSVNIPEKVLEIGKYAFSDCSNLKDISFPNGLTTIREHAFEQCSSIESLSLPDNISTIEKDAFYECSLLDSISLPKQLRVIEDIFYFCENLQAIVLPSQIDTIRLEVGGNTKRVYTDCPDPAKIVLDGRGNLSANDNILYVPRGCKRNYVDYWNDFTDYWANIPSERIIEREIDILNRDYFYVDCKLPTVSLSYNIPPYIEKGNDDMRAYFLPLKGKPLPQSLYVSVDGNLVDNFHYDNQTGDFSLYLITGDVVIADTSHSYTINYVLHDLSRKGDVICEKEKPYSCVLLPHENYKLPTSILVKSKKTGERLNNGTDYTYDSQTGIVNILNSKENVIIEAMGKTDGANIEINGREFYHQSHLNANVTVKSGAIYTIADLDASIASLTIEEGGQVRLRKALRVADSLIVKRYIETDLWTTFCVPENMMVTNNLDINVPAGQEAIWSKTGYTALSDQRWNDYGAGNVIKNRAHLYVARNESQMGYFYSVNAPVILEAIAEPVAPGNVPNGNWFHFVANPYWENLPIEGRAYVLNEAGTSFDLQENPVIPPFHCYMVASEEVMNNVSSLRLSGIPTSLEEIEESGFRVWTERGTVCVEAADEKDVTIYSVTGVAKARFDKGSGVRRIALPAGIYLVVHDGKAVKVVL